MPMTDLRHRWRFGHWPDWHQHDGLRFCMACATKGTPSRPMRTLRPITVRSTLAAILALILTTGVALAAISWRTATVNEDAQHTITSSVWWEHDRYCAPLSWDTQMAWAARYKAMDMAFRGYFAHADPQGLHMYQLFPRAGITYHAQAEILAWNNYPDDLSAKAAFTSWMGSSTHRAAIRSCTYTAFGVGVFKAAGGKKFYVVEFSRP